MCLILFAWKQHPNYKLILSANRDEFYERPTQAADYWESDPEILAGKDITAGGTWMGLHRSGRISMLTNYRDIPSIKPDAPSRGKLVIDFLKNKEAAEEYLEKLTPLDFQFNGYNLISGTFDTLFYHSNFALGVKPVEPGIHGLSNHLLNTSWPKVEVGKKRLSTLMKRDTMQIEPLMELMKDERIAKDHLLPDTGVGIEKERMLAPMFIKSPHYGTRCTTVILVDQTNKVTFVERTYDLSDFSFIDRSYEFQASVDS